MFNLIEDYKKDGDKASGLHWLHGDSRFILLAGTFVQPIKSTSQRIANSFHTGKLQQVP